MFAAGVSQLPFFYAAAFVERSTTSVMYLSVTTKAISMSCPCLMSGLLRSTFARRKASSRSLLEMRVGLA